MRQTRKMWHSSVYLICVARLTLWTFRYFFIGSKSVTVWTVRYYSGFSCFCQTELRLSRSLVVVPLLPNWTVEYPRAQYLAPCCLCYTLLTLWRSLCSTVSTSTCMLMTCRRTPAAKLQINSPRSTSCSSVLMTDKWMWSNRLKLNADNIEFLWIGTCLQLLKVSNQPLLVGGQPVTPVKSARNLGVLLGAELTMDVSAVVKGCFYQLHSVQRSLTFDARRLVVTDFVASRLDYCNAVLHGVAKTTIQWLQNECCCPTGWRTQQIRPCHASSTGRASLATDTTTNSIVYKIAVFAFDCVRGTCPSYFRSVCIPLTEESVIVQCIAVTYMCQPQGQNLANVVFALLHRESGTPCHSISVLLPSAENSSGLGSKPTSLSALTHDAPPRTIEECNYVLTYLRYNGAQWYEQFLLVGQLYRGLILLGLALYLPSASVSSVFMVNGYVIVYVFFWLHLFLYLLVS